MPHKDKMTLEFEHITFFNAASKFWKELGLELDCEQGDRIYPEKQF